MILGHPWWHLLAGAFLVGIGWHLAGDVLVLIATLVRPK